MRRGAVLIGLAAVAAGALAYARLEAGTRFTLRRATVTVPGTAADGLRILHISDLHLVPGQRRKQEWVRTLRALEPQAVIATGDFLAHPDAVPHALDALDPLLDLPGAFVLGSNDYYAPKPVNPARYLRGPSMLEPTRPMLPWPDLVGGLVGAGWLDLSNAQSLLKTDAGVLALRGVDDPHISRDRYEEVAGPFDANGDLAMGVAHAPYLRVLDPMAADGADLILAGHTHGGQLRIPGVGALVTNSDLPRSKARGLSEHGGSALHVSAGLGTSPYAPFRFACPPEATLLTISA